MGTRLVLKGRSGLYAFTDGISQGKNILNGKTITLTAAEVLALNSSPKELLPAPGAGKYYEVLSVSLTYDFVTAYTIGAATNLNIHYTNGAGVSTMVDLAATGFLDQAQDETRILARTALNVEPALNAAMVLALAGADVTAGTSTLTVDIVYRTLG